MAKESQWVISEFGPSSKPGVYCVMEANMETNKKIVRYVGSSKDISRRVLSPSHPYRQLFNVTDYPKRVIYLKYKECDNYVELEKLLIKRLHPTLNLQHNGQKIY